MTSAFRIWFLAIGLRQEEWSGLWGAYGGLTTRIHAVVDIRGLPVRLTLTSGEAHDNRVALPLPSALKSGAMLLADRGCDADWIRAFTRWASTMT
jgi:hypothetical protein